jgi:hypothetical protein
VKIIIIIIIILVNNDSVSANLRSLREKACFLAACAPHSGAWLSALPLSSCGLCLDDESVRIGVALRLGLPLCSPHDCRCGAPVDSWGSHAMVCKLAPARHTRHFAVNDIIARSFTAAGIPISKEPLGILRTSLKRPDGITQVPVLGGKHIAWDATISCTLAESYLEASSTLAGSASESAATRKAAKYSDLPSDFSFQPISLESLGSASSSTSEFISFLGRRISLKSGDPRESFYLWQRLSVCLCRYNAILLYQSFVEVAAEPE